MVFEKLSNMVFCLLTLGETKRKFDEARIIGGQFDVVHSQKDNGCCCARSFVAIHERMRADDKEAVGGRLLIQIAEALFSEDCCLRLGNAGVERRGLAKSRHPAN